MDVTADRLVEITRGALVGLGMNGIMLSAADAAAVGEAVAAWFDAGPVVRDGRVVDLTDVSTLCRRTSLVVDGRPLSAHEVIATLPLWGFLGSATVALDTETRRS